MINGPEQSLRGDNGKKSVDTALLNEQSTEYKIKVEEFKKADKLEDKLAAFSALPDTKLLKFKKHEDGKYYVKPNSNNE